ncbi:type I restriction enzyme M protein [Terracoccus luteus]|uniref:site-specific DNA-methyltransferase (adenine-specific) n=2 Tax=Terracoccus luteus TaxID=53356 RepID=A0A495XZ45_9MICO|nr:type I restriction enzyme M protein [Terracoccus luteus]
MQVQGFGDKVSFIWSVADLLRGDFKAHEFGQVILPFTALRRLECALAPTKDAVVARALALEGKVANVESILCATSGHDFYNVSPLSLTKLLNDPANVGKNLKTYIAGFSPGASEVLERYGFADKIERLDKAGLIYQVTAKFAELDLTEKSVSNDAMGYIFEELLRRFSEMSNETAGEHFTPREVIKLMVNILFAEDDDALRGAKPIRTIYDPACGTGGMLTVAQAHLKHLNDKAELHAYGQELNPETWAIARSDLMIKGQDPRRIVLGNSLTDDDGHQRERFDYMLANPPFGVDWKKYQAPIVAERNALGFRGRYGPGLPRSSDGSLLFLMHMLSKMKPVAADGSGGSRLAIVFSGSPLFAGAAGGGESEIRRWIIENDWLEGIVALPDQMFYNTGISTYFWVLSNRKAPERRGKVVLLDARQSFEKMRKSLGDKRKYITDAQITELTRLYDEAITLEGTDKRVKVFDREAFGYQRVTVEQPTRRRWVITDETLERLARSKAWAKWPDAVATPNVAALESVRAVYGDKVGSEFTTERDCKAALTGNMGAGVPIGVINELLKLSAVADPEAPVVTVRGKPVADTDLRDQENVPFPSGLLSLPEHERQKVLDKDAERHMDAEIKPYVPEAWVDLTRTKIGYEIPFTRHFYEYVPPRPLAEIDADLAETEGRIQKLLSGLAR